MLRLADISRSAVEKVKGSSSMEGKQHMIKLGSIQRNEKCPVKVICG